MPEYYGVARPATTFSKAFPHLPADPVAPGAKRAPTLPLLLCPPKSLRKVGKPHINSGVSAGFPTDGLGEVTILVEPQQVPRSRVRRNERIKQILLDLRLRPHVRIAELADRFGVSTETIRRDLETLSGEGLVSRAHGGVSQAPHQHYPGVDERDRTHIEERERIGQRAARMVEPGDTVLVDAGSTTLQFARFLAYRGTACTVLTNSLNVALALGQSSAASVVMCPGEYLASEAAVVGPDTIEFIGQHNVRRCFIGASSVNHQGVYETVRGFAAIKRAMLSHSRESHLLVHGSKFRDPDLSRVARLADFSSVVVDRAPDAATVEALRRDGAALVIADQNDNPKTNQKREEDQ